ncbi:sigma-70 family RNA polymerase sigma factor [Saccharopolyspora mangrovi]|uniref:Sigma-70 family RNA polymerase sigma factor n=1 Tax=Saccharopolyspora mangrovi TaxID=3082379 RepID=A0ABU6AER3_9PSEU|nr:sigma-70 family RNA polymerase sigma factor [Saccharopolyspora sp. S2-29]MEB3370024.1 sigma-70 family RNA polymerase sigma factor [Saccharopolyspora sp. S2-29]
MRSLPVTPATSNTGHIAGQRNRVIDLPADSWRLVQAAQHEDRDAFADLYNMYSPYIYRYLLSRAKERMLVEDLTSETFIRALRSIRTVSYTGSDIGAWLTTIARHLLLDYLKSSRHRREVVSVTTYEEAMTDDTPEEAALRAEDHARLRNCVAQLTDDQRQCLELRYCAG